MDYIAGEIETNYSPRVTIITPGWSEGQAATNSCGQGGGLGDNTTHHPQAFLISSHSNSEADEGKPLPPLQQMENYWLGGD